MMVCNTLDGKAFRTQKHSKMKTKLNIALEGTRSGDVVGGLLLWAGENLQALLF